MPSRRSRLSSKEEGADSAESGHDSRQHAASVRRAFTADVSALAPRSAAVGDQAHFAASQNDGGNHRSLVSLMLSSLSQNQRAPGSRQVRRSFSLPVELKRSSVTGADESTLVTYKGVSRSLWNTRYDAHVSTHVSDGQVTNVFLGSFCQLALGSASLRPGTHFPGMQGRRRTQLPGVAIYGRFADAPRTFYRRNCGDVGGSVAKHRAQNLALSRSRCAGRWIRGAA